MSPTEPLILRVHVPGAEPYEIGDEVWRHSLAEAIAAEARTIRRGRRRRRARGLKRGVAQRAARAGHRRHDQRPGGAGDSYRAPDGVRYSLTRSPAA
jgi:hypothetical protein